MLCKNQAQTIHSLQRENHRLHSCLSASTSFEPVRPGNHTKNCSVLFIISFCRSILLLVLPNWQWLQWLVCMQTSPDLCQLDGIEYAAHYASAASSFVPFMGRSHTVDASSPARHPTASFIPAVHQQRLTPLTHQAGSMHSLNSTSALRPLQREEFLAKLPKVIFCCSVLCNIHFAQVQHQVVITVP